MADMNDQKRRIIGKIKRGPGLSSQASSNQPPAPGSSPSSRSNQPVKQTQRRKGCGCKRKRKGG